MCGKEPITSALQDLLLHATKGTAIYLWRARQIGATDAATDAAIVNALFATVTNVNFDPDRIAGDIRRMAALRDTAKALYEKAAVGKGVDPEVLGGPAAYVPAGDMTGLLAQWSKLSIPARKAELGDDVVGLQELLTYGVKGMAAYAHHAATFGRVDDSVLAFFEEALDAIVSETDVDR